MLVLNPLRAAEIVENSRVGCRRFVSGTRYRLWVDDDDLTWILPKGYCLVLGERKKHAHHLLEALVVYFSLLRYLLLMSTSAMVRA